MFNAQFSIVEPLPPSLSYGGHAGVPGAVGARIPRVSPGAIKSLSPPGLVPFEIPVYVLDRYNASYQFEN